MIRSGYYLCLALLTISLTLWLCPALAADAAQAGPPAQVYRLLMDDGYPVLAEYELAGCRITPVLDTGTSLVISVPPAVYGKLPLMPLTAAAGIAGSADEAAAGMPQVLLAPMLGSGVKKWTLVDCLDMGGVGVADSVLPLSLIDADCAAFLFSREELRLYNMRPSMFTGGTGGAEVALKYVPYVEAGSGIFVTITYQGQHFLALLDTGSVSTFFATGFCEKFPELFEPTDDIAVMPSFIGGQQYPILNMRGGVSILGQSAGDDIPFAGQILAETGMDFAGQPLDPGELGLPGLLAYTRPDTPAPAPVAIIGMDVLGKYDFILDRRFKFLYFWDPSATGKMFPNQEPVGEGGDATAAQADNELKRVMGESASSSHAPSSVMLTLD